jgi:hypothetical protein
MLPAQTGTMAPDARPYTVTEGGDLDSISTTNGGLQLHIPLYSIKQRGNLSLSFTLRYDSPSFAVDENCDVPNQPCTYSYYEYSPGALYGFIRHLYVSANTDVNIVPVEKIVSCGFNGTGTCVGTYYWQVLTPDSGTHNMVSIGNSLWRAADGTGWLFSELTYTLTSRDGVRYVFQGSPGTPHPGIGNLCTSLQSVQYLNKL